MNTNRTKRRTRAVAIAAGTLIVALPTAVGAASSQHWSDPCPAADTEPFCDAVRLPQRSGSAGSEVTARPEPEDRTTVWIGGDTVEIPDYNCDEWRNPVIACPGLEDTPQPIDIPDLNCAVWTNPVIACPA